MSTIWNPWHGCEKYSEGCAHCYVYRRDASVGRDASEISKNRDFDLPVRRKRDGSFAVPSGETVYACMTSDFFLERADAFRSDADWGDGYENVTITCTVESEKQCRIRMPILREIPARRKQVCCEPLLGPIDLSPYLDGQISRVIVGGESGADARVCRWEWVCDLYRQCAEADVAFTFKQTGARFEKDGRIYRVPRSRQMEQARKAAAIYFTGGTANGL